MIKQIIMIFVIVALLIAGMINVIEKHFIKTVIFMAVAVFLTVKFDFAVSYFLDRRFDGPWRKEAE